MLDTDKGNVLPFVNIGIRNKNIGTSSSSDGIFSVKIPPQNKNDSLTFSMAGYSQLTISIKNAVASNQKTFPLKIKTDFLKLVEITASKLVEQKFGIISNSALIHFTDGSTNQNDIFEIAQLIKLDTTISKITSVNLYINESRGDSGTFRINFYGNNGNSKAPTGYAALLPNFGISADFRTFNFTDSGTTSSCKSLVARHRQTKTTHAI